MHATNKVFVTPSLCLADQRAAAVAANIMKAVQLALRVTDDHQGKARQGLSQIIAGTT